MDRKEFSAFAMALKTFYPREQLLPNDQAMQLWYAQLRDIPDDVAQLALHKWVATNKWPPTIAEIRETAANITHGDSLTWGEAWEKLKAAVKKYGANGQREAMESFDPLTRRAVECFGYREFCIASVETEMADRAHFQRIFETLARRENTRQQIPAALQSAISTLQIRGVNGEPLKLGE